MLQCFIHCIEPCECILSNHSKNEGREHPREYLFMYETNASVGLGLELEGMLSIEKSFYEQASYPSQLSVFFYDEQSGV